MSTAENAGSPRQAGSSGGTASGMSGEPAWRADRRARILKAAAELLRGREAGAVQMDAVARAAGVGKATLYRYFPSKDDLVLATFDQGLGGLADQLAVCAQETDPVVRLERMIDEVTTVTGEQLVSLRVLGGREAELAQRWRRIFRQHRAHIVGALRAAIADGIAAGRIRPVDLDVVPSLIIGMVRGGLAGNPDVPRQRITEAIRAVVRAALALPAADHMHPVPAPQPGDGVGILPPWPAAARAVAP